MAGIPVPGCMETDDVVVSYGNKWDLFYGVGVGEFWFANFEGFWRI